MEIEFLSKQYNKGVLINKQIEQLNKRHIISRNATEYLPVVSKVHVLYSQLQELIAETFSALEVAHEQRESQGEYGKIIQSLESDLEVSNTMVHEAIDRINEESIKIEGYKQHKDIYEKEVKIMRDNIRNLTAQSGYDIEEVKTITNNILDIDRKIKKIEKDISKADEIIKSNQDGKNELDIDIGKMQETLNSKKNHKKTFDKDMYSKKILAVFAAWYDTRPKKSYEKYTSVYDLFGVSPQTIEHDLLRDGERGISQRGQGNTVIGKKISFKKLGGLKEILDSLGENVEAENIYEFQDVVYIYMKGLDKGIVISDKKYNAVDKESFIHATFILPGAPIISGNKEIRFPKDLRGKRITFSDDNKRKEEIQVWLLQKNDHEGFKNKILTYNEDTGTIKRGIVDKPEILGENLIEKEQYREIIQNHFSNIDDLGHDSYKDFAIEFNNNPDNQFKLKQTLAGLRVVLGGTKPIYSVEYIKALIEQDTGMIEKIEEEYELNKKTVYNNKELYDSIKELVNEGILVGENVGFMRYRDTFVHKAADFLVKKYHISTPPQNIKEKRKVLKEYTGLISAPTSLTVILGGIDSADAAYQILLIKKFVAHTQGKELSAEDKVALQEREIYVQGHLGIPEKNIFREMQIDGPTPLDGVTPVVENDDLVKNNMHITEDEEVIGNDNNNTATVVKKAPVEIHVIVEPKIIKKEQITVSLEDLDTIPEAVNKVINRVVKLFHSSPKIEHINNITTLFQYGYIYFRKNSFLKKDTEKPYSFFSKFYQEKYIFEICEVAMTLPTVFKLAFAMSCTEQKMGNHIKKALEIQNITNKRK